MSPFRTPRNPYYQGPVTDHFDGLRFYNPGGIEPGGFRALLRWQFGSEKRALWPKFRDNDLVRVRPDRRVDDLRVTMIGHASLMIQVSGVNILTDPVWSERASPFSFAGPKRVMKPGVAFNDLPPIDYVLVTHNHYDHMDIATLKALQRDHRPIFITPLGNDRIMNRAVPDARIRIMDWGDRMEFDEGLTVDCEPCHHWSARGTGDRRMALWAAFVLTTPAGKIYHIGDTGFHKGINYRDAQKRHGSFRLAILPIGAYEPRWFMQAQHQNPQEAVEGMRLANAAYAVGHHFGSIQLTNEAIDQPVIDLIRALEEAGIEQDRFRPLMPGESFEVPPVSPSAQDW
jgi:L-ascorbate metabolism protein UlaG (beta-lactamase superfamily)